MEKILFAAIFILSLGCSSKKKMDKDIQLIITMEQSYKYDLKNGIYTVYGTKHYDSLKKIYHVTFKPLDVKFNLAEGEKNEIINKYYDLDIDEMPEKLRIEDSCLFNPFPRFFYTLFAKKTRKNQELSIDLDCNIYTYPNNYRGKQLKEFLDYCLKIFKTKPEIQNAPRSYFPYE